MPITRAFDRNSSSLPSSPQKTYTLSSHLPTQHEEAEEKMSTKRATDSPRKTNGSAQKTGTSTFSTSQSQASRRSVSNEAPLPMRGRSNTDIQSVASLANGLKQQQLSMSGSGSDKSVNHHNQQRSQSPIPHKPKCMLPTTTSQAGYVTPSKLFNMMGYGIQNQYLFMLAHYLYIIDCRSREKFNESHIVTGNLYLLILIEKKIPT
jgi:hypothetical protein